MRLFFAVFFEKKVLEALADNQERIKNYGIKGRFVRKNKLHLTLKFLGEVEENKLDQIKQSIDSKKIKSFELTLSNLGVFPPKGRPRIVWQGLEGEREEDTKEVFKLKETIENGMEKLGFEREKRKFKPHITLVRDPKNITREGLDDVKVKRVNTKVNSFSLMSSELTKKGPIYDEVCRYELRD